MRVSPPPPGDPGLACQHDLPAQNAGIGCDATGVPILLGGSTVAALGERVPFQAAGDFPRLRARVSWASRSSQLAPSPRRSP